MANSTHSLQQSSFYRLRSPRKLAELLGVSLDDLNGLTQSDRLYSEFIEKKSGKGRLIEAPCERLKFVQARIAQLLGRIHPAEYLFCPAKRRCYVKNAAQHRNSRVVQCLDITKFFPNTPRRRVYKFFANELECAGDVAGLVADVATYKGHLPTGSPLSPLIAHYAFIDVWRAVAVLAKANRLRLTVYVDDVTLSGPRVADQCVWQVKQIIHAAGLHYHKEKKYVDRPAEVTGVILRDGHLLAPNRQHLKSHKAKADLRRAADGSATMEAASRLRGLEAQRAQIARVGRAPRP